MNIKKIITPENMLKIGSAAFAIGSVIIANIKEKKDMENLEANVVEKIMAKFDNQNK